MTDHNESDKAQAQLNMFFNNWKGKVDKGGNMELSDTVEGDDTRMSKISDSADHQGTNRRKNPPQRDSESNDDDDDEDDDSDDSDDDEDEEEDNGEATKPTTSVLEN